MSKEINCPHRNDKGQSIYKGLGPRQLCDIAGCSSRMDCDKAKYGGTIRPLVDSSVWRDGHEGHPGSGREGHGG